MLSLKLLKNSKASAYLAKTWSLLGSRWFNSWARAVFKWPMLDWLFNFKMPSYFNAENSCGRRTIELIECNCITFKSAPGSTHFVRLFFFLLNNFHTLENFSNKKFKKKKFQKNWDFQESFRKWKINLRFGFSLH